MKKLICLALALVMVLSFVACGDKKEADRKDSKPQSTTKDTTAPTETIPEDTTGTTEGETTVTTEPTEETGEAVVPGEMITSIYMDMNDGEGGTSYFIRAYDDGSGNATLSYDTASGRKEFTYEGAEGQKVLEQLAAAFRLSGLAQLSGDVYDEGGFSASSYVEINSESFGFSYTGKNIPEEFTNIFNIFEELFVQILETVPEYVPLPMIADGVNEDQLNALTEILNTSGFSALDSLMIMDLPNDENFSYAAGLSQFKGITACTSVTHMMMTVPYSMVVVTLEDGTDAATLVEGFKTALDWTKWVCVNPSDALIATKDNMVLCLIGMDELYTGCAASVESNGWTVVETLKNPNL